MNGMNETGGLRIGDVVRYAPNAIKWTVDRIEGETVQLRCASGQTILATIDGVLDAMARVAA